MKELLLFTLLFSIQSDSFTQLRHYQQKRQYKRQHHSSLKQMATWATHTSVDLHDCAYSIIRSKRDIQLFIRKLCNYLGVTPFRDPEFLYHYSGNGFTSGITAIQQANGHTDITVRVNEADNSVHIDLFSCVLYDPGMVADQADFFFDAYSMSYDIAYRA